MVWECLLRKICVIFSGRQDVNNTEHVAIINLLQGWEMLSDNDMCSFPGSQESWHGDICQPAAHSDHSLHWLLFAHQRRVKWKMFDSFLSVARVILPSNSLRSPELRPVIDRMCPDREWWQWPSGVTLPPHDGMTRLRACHSRYLL